MDVTPQLIEQIDFSEKFRGYDPDQVDDFLERVGATIAELNNAVRDANERAERAEIAAREAMAAAAAAPAAPPAPSPVSDEEAAGAAARTLMLAQRTADQLLAESRAEADQLLAEARGRLEHATRDAQAEADRLLVEARSEAQAVVQAAAQEAEREAAGRRAELTQQVDQLEERKQNLAADIAALEARVSEYWDSLDRVHASIRTILDDPEALRARPPLDVDLTPAPTAAVPVLEATAFEPATPSAFLDEAVPAEPSALASSATGWEDAVDGATAAAPVGGFDEGTVAAPSAVAEVDVAFEPFSDEPAADAAPADPWGPGSWSEVVGERAPVAEPAPAVAWDSVAFSPPLTEAHPPVDFEALTATGSTAAVGQDRYLRDLDEAVNQPAEVGDDAMTAFFEGDDAETPRSEGRRFRRR